MTIRTRLMIVTVLAIAMTMAAWGWVQLQVFDNLLTEQQAQRLEELADVVSTYYEHFPSRQGLSVLDTTLKDHVQNDPRLARIDLFAIEKGAIEFVAGAGRTAYDWPESTFTTAIETMRSQYLNIDTEAGPALALLYPDVSERDRSLHVVGIMSFSQTRNEILGRAKVLLLYSSAGLLLAIFAVLFISYDWLIGRSLRIITKTIDEFQEGKYRHRIDLKRRDELGHLADHFNDMATEIEHVLAKNRELTRHLELRVQEETIKVVELQNQVGQLKQLTAMGHLTANLAHDLGTPLHSIAGMARLLLERGDWDPDVSRKLEIIVQQTQRLHAVIQNIRRVTRPPEPHFEATTVEELLNETLPLVEPLIQKANIALKVQTPGELPHLHVDRYRIQTALMNLLQNATEALAGRENGAITVTVALDAPRKRIGISVGDNGPGIPPELRDRICEPFFSTHAEERLRGLGLAIVQDIMKIHSGSLEITGTPGGGATVTLYLPVYDQQTTVTAPEAAPLGAPPADHKIFAPAYPLPPLSGGAPADILTNASRLARSGK
ncbi:MAG TPA: ATP-binding protein [Syntrophales bacterium]|nr:ATP-binding protein [Syntrophales bacterium]